MNEQAKSGASGEAEIVVADRATVTVRVPLRFRRRGGRKVIIGDARLTLPDKPIPQDSRHKTILKGLGRAYRWKRMLESGEFASITDLARAEKINHSYVRRMLRLTLLSPEIVERLLDRHLTRQLEDLLKSVPDEWAAQKALTE